MTQPNIVLAITGASGSIYAIRLLEVLIEADRHVHLTISHSAKVVLKQELGFDVDLDKFKLSSVLVGDEDSPKRASLPPAVADVFSGAAEAALGRSGRVTYHHCDDMNAPIASGSFLTGGMVVCPCSGSTLGAVVNGVSGNLIHRAAEVHLKERRKLIVVPRETPLSAIQIENMRRADGAGAIVLPATPGFYHGVQSLGDLVDFVVARICDQLGIDHSLVRRWGT
jgi:4-hydroxy-3-polyprenylbenzoate decarboxylase